MSLSGEELAKILILSSDEIMNGPVTSRFHRMGLCLRTRGFGPGRGGRKLLVPLHLARYVYLLHGSSSFVIFSSITSR
jgi:hypothetical protein